MLKKYFFFIFLIAVSFNSPAQTYINTAKMFRLLEQKVNSKEFDFNESGKLFQTLHLNRDSKKVSVNTLQPSKKVISGEELFNLRMPSVYMFLQVYKNGKTGRLQINGGGSAFPISNEGHFVINHHMLAEFGLGFGNSAKVFPTSLILADYQGNLLTIDSVMSYNKMADCVILKANLGGKKIQAIPLGNDLSAGAEVRTITHPNDNYYYFSAGNVARMTEEGDAGVFSRKMEITADYAAGSSGGPIFDNKGNIAGIVSLTRSYYYNQLEQKNLQMVVKETIPVSAIKALLK